MAFGMKTRSCGISPIGPAMAASARSTLSLPRLSVSQLLQQPGRPARNSMATTIAWSGKTDRGRFRANNEDAFLALLLDDRGIRYLGKTGESSLENADFIFAVSDGMGGERSGEFASRIAIEKITLQLPSQFNLSKNGSATYSEEYLVGICFRVSIKPCYDWVDSTPTATTWGPRSRWPGFAADVSTLAISATVVYTICLLTVRQENWPCGRSAKTTPMLAGCVAKAN